jgi:hypothetical protein
LPTLQTLQDNQICWFSDGQRKPQRKLRSRTMLDRVRCQIQVRAAGTRKARTFKGIDEANRAFGWELSAHSRKTIRRAVKIEGAASTEIGGKTYTFTQASGSEK